MFLTYLAIFGIAMVPIIELRGAIPFGVANGVSFWLSFAIAVVGSSVIVPVVIKFAKVMLDLLRKIPLFGRFADWFERKTVKKADKVGKHRYLLWAIFAFVAIPLPGTGAWTGSAIAAFLGLRVREAAPYIVLGNITAGLIMVLLTFVFKVSFF